MALLTGTAPIPLAVVACIVGAVVVEILRQRGKASGDVGLAVLFYGGLAAGVFLSGISGVGAGGLAQYLFGSLTTVTPDDLILIGLLAVVILVITLGLAPQLYAVSTDEELPAPRVSGYGSITSRWSALRLSRWRWPCGQ